MACQRSMGLSVVQVFLAMLMVLATTLPLKAEDAAVSTPQNTQTVSGEETPDKGVVGVATYYAKRYNGKRTSSGVRYDPRQLTAAHQSLPFGTRVKVENLANGRDVIVKITDRCRKRSGAFIDLSRAAARKLGFLGKGVANVKITPMERDPA